MCRARPQKARHAQHARAGDPRVEETLDQIRQERRLDAVAQRHREHGSMSADIVRRSAPAETEASRARFVTTLDVAAARDHARIAARRSLPKKLMWTLATLTREEPGTGWPRQPSNRSA